MMVVTMGINTLELKDAVGYLAVAVTIGLFLSGITICLTIWSKKTTLGTSPLPFLTATVSCSLWTSYGLLINDLALIVVNSVGLMLQIIYIIFYYSMCNNKKEFHPKVIGCIVTIMLLLLFAHHFKYDEKKMITILGVMCSFASIIFMASPLSTIIQVVRTRSTESMPFYLIFASFLMSFLWFIYGIMIKDYAVQVPNLLGSCITGFQLLLFVIFYNSKVPL